MQGKRLAKNLLALALICSTWGLFGFHSGDVEANSGAVIQTIIQNSDAEPDKAAPQNAAAAVIPAAAGAANSAAEKPRAAVVAEINLKNQTMTIRRSGETLHVWKISSGRASYETPSGKYRPQHIHTMWRSKKYNNAPMPYAVFFSGGYAIHGTTALGRLGTRASHGCVRLATENARAFYQLVSAAGVNNTQIIVHE